MYCFAEYTDQGILFVDKLWPSDKYGFSLAYAIKIKDRAWMIKKSGSEWEKRPASFTIDQEPHWCK